MGPVRFCRLKQCHDGLARRMVRCALMIKITATGLSFSVQLNEGIYLSGYVRGDSVAVPFGRPQRGF